MPSFDIHGDLIQPLGAQLAADARFSGIYLKYDRTEDKVIVRDEMPAINYFVKTPWQDIGRGSGAYSLQTRRTYISIGFGVWCYDAQSQDALDAQLFTISGDLSDFLRDSIEFDQSKGIFIRHDVPITYSLDYINDESAFVGVHQVTCPFEFYSGAGR